MADYFINNYDLDGVSTVACMAGDRWSIYEILAYDGDCCIDRIAVNGIGFYPCIRRTNWQTSCRPFGSGGYRTAVLSAGAKILSASPHIGHDYGGQCNGS